MIRVSSVTAFCFGIINNRVFMCEPPTDFVELESGTGYQVKIAEGSLKGETACLPIQWLFYSRVEAEAFLELQHGMAIRN